MCNITVKGSKGANKPQALVSYNMSPPYFYALIYGGVRVCVCGKGVGAHIYWNECLCNNNNNNNNNINNNNENYLCMILYKIFTQWQKKKKKKKKIDSRTLSGLFKLSENVLTLK